MAISPRNPPFAALAVLVVLVGMILYFLGLVITQSSPDASGEGSAYCHCRVIGGEALLGGTISLIGLLMIPMALVAAVLAKGLTPPLPVPPPAVDERGPI